VVVEIPYMILGVAVCLGIGFVVCLILHGKKYKKLQDEAEQSVRIADEKTQNQKKQAEIEMKAELLRLKEEFEKEADETRREHRQTERRLQKREDTLDNKDAHLDKREQYLEKRDEESVQLKSSLEKREKELSELIEKEIEQLHKISDISPDEAKKMVIDRVEKQMEAETAVIIQRAVERANEDADTKARNIVSQAIQRCAVEHTAESVVSAIDIPSDEMKGRIIGREGRNIRAFEKATGVDVIVDDTPGVVVVSAFDSVRREVARRTMQKLILDGRIHPSRIEEVAVETRKEVESIINEAGKEAAFEAGVHGLNQKLVHLLGRLKFRTSYGQNVLQHSQEVCYIAGVIAAELKLDEKIARRCGLLHDIGKALDHEIEGGHPEIGADVVRKFGERPEVVEAVAGHHEDVEITFPYTVFVIAADAISASRPGARRETLEKYIKRLERLEDIAGSFPGIDTAFAIQAGREVRVIVDANRITDRESVTLSRAIAKEIEQELTYPGEVKVTVLRETRAVDYAR